jgi:hypothetical protein
MPYRRAQELSSRVAAGLKGLGLQQGERVGICAVNCPEWMLTMQVGGGATLWPRRGGRLAARWRACGRAGAAD